MQNGQPQITNYYSFFKSLHADVCDDVLLFPLLQIEFY